MSTKLVCKRRHGVYNFVHVTYNCMVTCLCQCVCKFPIWYSNACGVGWYVHVLVFGYDTCVICRVLVWVYVQICVCVIMMRVPPVIFYLQSACDSGHIRACRPWGCSVLAHTHAREAGNAAPVCMYNGRRCEQKIKNKLRYACTSCVVWFVSNFESVFVYEQVSVCARVCLCMFVGACMCTSCIMWVCACAYEFALEHCVPCAGHAQVFPQLYSHSACGVQTVVSPHRSPVGNKQKQVNNNCINK